MFCTHHFEIDSLFSVEWIGHAIGKTIEQSAAVYLVFQTPSLADFIHVGGIDGIARLALVHGRLGRRGVLS